MKPKVYIETSVVSYYTGRGSRDVVITGRQQVTQDFWPLLADTVLPFVSALVIKEAAKGNPVVAASRLNVIQTFPVLATTPEAERLAQELIDARGIPMEYPEDALHIDECPEIVSPDAFLGD